RPDRGAGDDVPPSTKPALRRLFCVLKKVRGRRPGWPGVNGQYPVPVPVWGSVRLRASEAQLYIHKVAAAEHVVVGRDGAARTVVGHGAAAVGGRDVDHLPRPVALGLTVEEVVHAHADGKFAR